MIHKPQRLIIKNRIWYYQAFTPDSLMPDEETAFRLYDSQGDFVEEFGSYEEMIAWIKKQKSAK